jgi:Trk-type K+ transport system membrane component
MVRHGFRLRLHDLRELLLERRCKLHRVLHVLVPTAIYVVAIPYVGIYLGSAALIAVFMLWLGKYQWSLTAAISIASRSQST